MLSSEMLASRIIHSERQAESSLASTKHILCSSVGAPWRNLVRVERCRWLPCEGGTCPLWDTVAVQIGPGTYEVRSGGGFFRKIIGRSGDIRTFSAGVPIYVRNKQPTESLSIQLGPRILSAACDEPVSTLLPTGWRVFRDAQIERIAMLFEAEIRFAYPSGRLYGEFLGMALAAYLKQRSVKSSNTPKRRRELPGLPGRKFNAVLEYIRVHAKEDIGLEELATVAELSPYYFCRLFKQRTGITPHKYLLQCRVELAKQQLLSSDVDLATLGLRLGFKDQSHFTATFRKMTGTTPKRWRRAAS